MKDQYKSRPTQKSVLSFSGIFSRNHRVVAVLAAVFTIHVFELILVQRKYDLFTGGFLQTHSYVSVYDRLSFLSLSIWFDLFIAAFAAGPWFYLTERLGKNRIISSYHFFFVLSAFAISILFVKYKILSYFDDTLNFVIIRNLGGGGFLDALTFVADEAVVLVAILFGAVLAYLFGAKVAEILVRRSAKESTNPFSLMPFLKILSPSILVTVLLIALTNSDPNLRYGMRKKLSFFAITRALDSFTDFDGDGYGLAFYPLDPKPFDKRIFPGAVDIPNNGIDENGFGGDFHFTFPAIDTFNELLPKPGKHIVLIVLESARQDIVGKKVQGQLVAPNITALASNHTNVNYAYSHTGYTASSLLAIFNRTLLIEDDKKTFLEFLKDAGYQLCFISGQDESFGRVAQTIGMDRPENYFFDATSALEDRVFASKQSGSLRLSEARIVEEIRHRFSRIDWRKPHFMYINLQAAHFPYSHSRMPKIVTDSLIPRSAISAKNRDWIQLTYWNALAVADQAIGEIIGLLNHANVFDNTLVVVTGDHGESLFDDGFLGHGHALNADQTRIPLIFNTSDVQITEPVGQIDLAEIMARTATDQPIRIITTSTANKAVFQFVGTYRKPAQIGIVEYGEKRTILDLRNREIFFSDLGRWQSVDAILESENELSLRVSRLINIWEHMRWKDFKVRHQ